jgi:hypothetical protein
MGGSWVPWLEDFKPKPKQGLEERNPLFVANLINTTSRTWDEVKLREVFNEESIQAILRLPLPSIPRPDKLLWIKNPTGMFTVIFAYGVSQGHRFNQEGLHLWSKLWKAKIHEHFKVLLWRIALDILPTRLNLSELWDDIDIRCPLCESEKESSLHLFQNCHVAREMWFECYWGLRMDTMQFRSCFEFINFLVNTPA